MPGRQRDLPPSCYRYLELNPVRTGLVPTPSEYRWSIHASNAIGLRDPLLTQHPDYRALGSNADVRRLAYRRLFDDATAEDETDTIRTCLLRQHALGSRFQAAIERQLARRVGPAKLGRPRKRSSDSSDGTAL
jgi:putative transposase